MIITLNFWATVTIIVLVFGTCALIQRLISYVRILAAAGRLGLRDKGELEPFLGDDGGWQNYAHPPCNTRLRVGISAKEETFDYCWRCEEVVEDGFDDGPRPREDIPVGDERKEGSNVFHLPNKRVA